MSLLLSNPLTSLSSLPPFSSPSLAFIATPVYVANLQTALASSRYAGGASPNYAREC